MALALQSPIPYNALIDKDPDMVSLPPPRHVVAWNRRHELVALVNRGFTGDALLAAAREVVPDIDAALLDRTLKACDPSPATKRAAGTAPASDDQPPADASQRTHKWLDRTNPVKTVMIGDAASKNLLHDITANVTAAAEHDWTLLSTVTIDPFAGASWIYGIFQYRPATGGGPADAIVTLDAAPAPQDVAMTATEPSSEGDGSLVHKPRKRSKAAVKAAAMACLPLIENTDLDEDQPEYGKAHLRHMVAAIDAMNTADPAVHLKAMRWLGWLQCAIVMGGGSTLQEMKDVTTPRPKGRGFRKWRMRHVLPVSLLAVPASSSC